MKKTRGLKEERKFIFRQNKKNLHTVIYLVFYSLLMYFMWWYILFPFYQNQL